MSESVEEKPYNITFEERPGYLYAHVEGDSDSYEISRCFWQEIAKECGRLKPKRLFIEESLKKQIPSIADIYQGASERPEMGLENVKIAFFDVHPEQHDENQFGELVARNRGINIKAFDDKEAALAWLLGD